MVIVRFWILEEVGKGGPDTKIIKGNTKRSLFFQLGFLNC